MGTGWAISRAGSGVSGLRTGVGCVWAGEGWRALDGECGGRVATTQGLVLARSFPPPAPSGFVTAPQPRASLTFY